MSKEKSESWGCKGSPCGHYLECPKDTRPRSACRRRSHKHTSRFCNDLCRSRADHKKECQCYHVCRENICRCLLNSEKHEVPCNHDSKSHCVKHKITHSPETENKKDAFIININKLSKGTQYSLTYERNTQTLNKLEESVKVDNVNENVTESLKNKTKILCKSGYKDQTSLNEQNTLLRRNTINNISATNDLNENKLQSTEIKIEITARPSGLSNNVIPAIENTKVQSQSAMQPTGNSKNRSRNKMSSEKYSLDTAPSSESRSQSINLPTQKSTDNKVLSNISQSILFTENYDTNKISNTKQKSQNSGEFERNHKKNSRSSIDIKMQNKKSTKSNSLDETQTNEQRSKRKRTKNNVSPNVKQSKVTENYKTNKAENKKKPEKNYDKNKELSMNKTYSSDTVPTKVNKNKSIKQPSRNNSENENISENKSENKNLTETFSIRKLSSSDILGTYELSQNKIPITISQNIISSKKRSKNDLTDKTLSSENSNKNLFLLEGTLLTKDSQVDVEILVITESPSQKELKDATTLKGELQECENSKQLLVNELSAKEQIIKNLQQQIEMIDKNLNSKNKPSNHDGEENIAIHLELTIGSENEKFDLKTKVNKHDESNTDGIHSVIIINE